LLIDLFDVTPGNKNKKWDFNLRAEKALYANGHRCQARIAGQLQGCQMVCFQTKNPNLGRIWRALE
jgi:hypothetical protein